MVYYSRVCLVAGTPLSVRLWVILEIGFWTRRKVYLSFIDFVSLIVRKKMINMQLL